MRSSNDTVQLKAPLLKAAVQDNVDIIADRLPPSVRPARRFVAMLARRAPLLAMGVSMLVTSAVVAKSLAAPAPVLHPPLQFAPEPTLDKVPASAPDMIPRGSP